MICKFNNFLLEKSSLSNLGIPKQVMQHIQRDFALKPDCEWIEYNLKKDIKSIFNKNENRLLIEIQPDSIKVFVGVYEQQKKLYIIDKYIKKTGEWGDEWVKLDREGTTLTGIYDEIEVNKNYKHFLLNSYDFSIVKSHVRKIKKEEAQFDSFNEIFKKDLLNYFTKLLKHSYSSTAKRVESAIIDNLAQVQSNLNAEDIKKILYQNVDDAKKTKRLISKASDIDKYELTNKEKQYNSLTIFDEYLFQFEDEYSEKYKKYYNIKTLVEKYSRMKMMTAFIYYLYTGMLMNLDGGKTYTQIDDLSDLEELSDNDF